MRCLAAAVIVCVSVLAPFARAQSSRAAPTAGGPTASITGRVVADDTGDPLPNARVTISPAAEGKPVVLTDREGRFNLSAPGARRRVAGNKVGYARQEVNGSAGGEPIEIRLRRAAALSGRIVDAFGEPVVSARVVVETQANGQKDPTLVRATNTDDRGEYRVGGLSAGAFFVAVTTLNAVAIAQVTGDRVEMRPTLHKIYYPGAASSSEAEAIRVEFGDDRTDVDLVIPAGQSGGVPFGMMAGAPLARALTLDPTAPATSVIRGRIVSTDGHPLAHAQVRLFPSTGPFPMRAMEADADGRFEFADLAAGTFRIGAAKPGYTFPTQKDAIAPNSPELGSGPSVDVAVGEVRDQVDVRLARLCTLAGEVSDELGDPIEGATVQVLRVRYEAGRRRLVPAGSSRFTDDRGHYRLFNLPSGQYVVSASIGAVGSADVPSYARSYFPGTSDPAQAQFTALDTSQETVGIDITMVRARTARIAGRLLDAAGQPSTGGNLQLMPSQRTSAVANVPAGARINADGLFEFPNVPPGQYVIHAERGRSNASTEGEFGTLAVSVDGTDVTDVTLQTSSGSSIRGRVTFDTFNGTKLPERSRVEISPVPIDADLSPKSPASADIRADWSFEMSGINGPRRLQVVRTPAGWALEKIVVNGIDATDRPLVFGRKDQSLTDVDVVLTDRLTALDGTILDEHGRPATEAHVIVFPTDRDGWYPSSRFLRTATPDTDGSFRVIGLPSGTYYMAVLTQMPLDGADAWQDPALLDALAARATTVTLRDGQTSTVSAHMPVR